MAIKSAKPPRLLAAGRQDSLPGRYRLGVQLFAMAALAWAFIGWFNEAWLFQFDSPIWLNRYTEYFIILIFGLWRIRAERNPYTRKRLMVLVGVVTLLWWLIPWLTPLYEPYVGFIWSQPVFPALHTPGTLTFFVVLALVWLFGRRVICGWGCPCVGIRETVGFPFRHKTLRQDWARPLRHIKWLFFAGYVGVMVVTQFPPTGWTTAFVGGFWLVVILTYFGSFFLMPLTGNRFYCRALCPFGATFGLLNQVGHFEIRLDESRCSSCGNCEQVCDMAIRVGSEGREFGHVTSLEDCMGCGRCVSSCPSDALAFEDFRNYLNPDLLQDGAHLLGRKRRRPPRSKPTSIPDAVTPCCEDGQA